MLTALPNYDFDNKVKSIKAVVVVNNVENEKECAKF